MNFTSREDVLSFSSACNGRVFRDESGEDFGAAIVEFAPFQKVPRRKPRKKDPKIDTINDDPDFVKVRKRKRVMKKGKKFPKLIPSMTAPTLSK